MSPSSDWLLRWFHIMAGIMWIGLLYFFNFVNVAAVKEATAAGEAAPISKYVVPRALLFFRWGAVVTWIFGAALLGGYPAPGGGNGLVAAFTLQGTMAPIGLGAWLGTIMLLNVWGLIWPNQKKILGFVPATDEEKAKARRIAFLASRTNTMLSIPMLFFMATGPTSMSQWLYH
ncbi:MAG TPA: urate hydroxylase PuuD [Candidatus Babeliales bacterium]|nr:urate hydroxylase PuuD [Candidatus Babeliales bacterium]